MPVKSEIIKAMAANDRNVARATVPASFKVSTDYQLEQTLQQSGSGYSSDHRKEAEMYTGWNYVAIHAIATQCGQAACYAYSEANSMESVSKSMYNDRDDQGEPLPKGSPLLKFLKRPNPQQSGSSFRFEMALQLKLTGKVLIWNMTNKYGKVVRRYIIPTAIVEPKQPNKDFPEGYYRVKPELARQGGQQGWFFAGQYMSKLHWNLDARHVQVILDPHPVYRDDGQSSVAAGALWTDSSNHIDAARTNHMRLGPDPSVHVHIAGQMDAAELKGAEARFNQKYCGTDRAGRAMFTSGDGVSVTTLSNTARDMAYGEGFVQMRDAIMALHKVPPTAAGIEQATGGESLYAPLKQFIFLTIQPILNLFADEDNENWVWQYGEGNYVEYRAKTIDEPEQRNRENEILMKAGAITKGELRLRMGMQLFGDERDDEMAGAGQAPPQMDGGTPAALGMDGEDSVANPPPQFFGSQAESEEEEFEIPEGDFKPDEQRALQEMMEAEKELRSKEVEKLQKSLDSLISEFKAKGKTDTCGAGSPGGKGFSEGNTCQKRGSGNTGNTGPQDGSPEDSDETEESEPEPKPLLGAARREGFDEWENVSEETKQELDSLYEKLAQTKEGAVYDPKNSPRPGTPEYSASEREADKILQQIDRLTEKARKEAEAAKGKKKPSRLDLNEPFDSLSEKDQEIFLEDLRSEVAETVNFDQASPAWKELAQKEGWYEQKQIGRRDVNIDPKGTMDPFSEEYEQAQMADRPRAPKPNEMSGKRTQGVPRPIMPSKLLEPRTNVAKQQRKNFLDLTKLWDIFNASGSESDGTAFKEAQAKYFEQYPDERKSHSKKEEKQWEYVEKAESLLENPGQSQEAAESESKNVASSANNKLDESIMGIPVKGLSPDEIAKLKEHAKGNSKFHMEQMIVAMQEGAFFEEAHQAAVAAEEESEGYAKAVSDNTIKGISVEGLTQRQIKTLKKHSSHHSKEIFEQIIIDMRNGKTFTEAHKAAKQKESKTKSDWIKYVGPRGGTGWKSQSTGRIVRGKVRPDERRPGNRRAT